MRNRSLAFFVISVFFPMSCVDKTPAETGTGDSGSTPDWVPVLDSDERGAFLSVWGASEADVWIVGGQFDAGVVLRGSGDTWTEVALPEGTPLLNWVHGTSADDVWVCGLAGTLLHWDGQDWLDHSQDVDEAFWGVYAVDSQTVYAVGGQSKWGGEAGMAWFYDGASWVSVSVALPDDSALTNLYKVHDAGDAIWMVGVGGVAFRGSGIDFEAVATGFATDLVTANRSVDGGIMRVVGGRGTGVVLREEGGVLVTETTTTAGLNGVQVYPDGSTVVVGEMGYSARLESDGSTLVDLDVVTSDVLHATWGSTGGEMYAVGGNLFTSEAYFHGVVLMGDAPE